MSLDSDDRTISKYTRYLTNKTNESGLIKPGHDLEGPFNHLRNIGHDEKLHLVGHAGTQMMGEDLDSPEELARKLITRGLPLDYRGQIVLHGCNTGKGGNNSYAARLQDALIDYGRRVSVKGLGGASKVMPSGQAVVIKDEDRNRFDQLTDKLEKKYKSDLENAEVEDELDALGQDDDAPVGRAHRKLVHQKYKTMGANLVKKYYSADPNRKQRLARPGVSWRYVKGYVKSWVKELFS